MASAKEPLFPPFALAQRLMVMAGLERWGADWFEAIVLPPIHDPKRHLVPQIGYFGAVLHLDRAPVACVLFKHHQPLTVRQMAKAIAEWPAERWWDANRPPSDPAEAAVLVCQEA